MASGWRVIRVYAGAAGPTLGALAALLDSDRVTLLVMADDAAGLPPPLVVVVERTPTGLTLDQRRAVTLPLPLRRWLMDLAGTAPDDEPTDVRDVSRERLGASLAVPLPTERTDRTPCPGIVLIERREGPPFTASEAGIADRFVRRLEAALVRAKSEEAARAHLESALALLDSGGNLRDGAQALLEGFATWTGAREVALFLPPTRAGSASITAVLDRHGACSWDEGGVTVSERPLTPPRVAGLDLQVGWRTDAGGAATTRSARASIPLSDEAAAIVDVSWDLPPGEPGLALVALAANAAAPVVPHLIGRLARDEVRRRFEGVTATMRRIEAARDARAALRALLEGATRLARVEGASIRLERGIFGERPEYVNILRQADGTIQWTDNAVASDDHTDETLRLGGTSRVVDLVTEAEHGNVVAQELVRGYGFASGLIVPIRARGLVVGTLRLASTRRRAFDGVAGLPLQSLADHAGAVVEQAFLESRAAERARRLRTARQISAAVSTVDDLDGIAQRLLTAAMGATGSSSGGVAIIETAGAALCTRARAPDDEPARLVRDRDAVRAPDETELETSMRTAAQRVVGEPGSAARPRERTVLTPILHKGAPVGVIWLGLGPGFGETPENLQLIQVIADQAGGAIARARLAQSERAARAALTTALEASSTVILSVSFAGAVTGVEGDTMSVLGLPSRRLLDRPFRDVFAHAEIASLLPTAEGDVELRQIQARTRHEDGRQAPVLVAIGPRFEGTRHVGTVAAVTDLRQMAALTEQLDEANAARSRAEGAVRTGRAIAHDLGSPLSSILALSEMLVEDARLPDSARHDVAMLSAEAVRASALLHRFGRITRYEELLTPAGPQLDVDRSSDP